MCLRHSKARPGAMKMCCWQWLPFILTVTAPILSIELFHVQYRCSGNKIYWTHKQPHSWCHHSLCCLHGHTYRDDDKRCRLMLSENIGTCLYVHAIIRLRGGEGGLPLIAVLLYFSKVSNSLPLSARLFICSITGRRKVAIGGLDRWNHNPASSMFLLLNLDKKTIS